IEANRGLTRRGDKPQERSNVRHHVLERGSLESSSATTDEAFDIQSCKIAKTFGTRFIVDIGQQRGGRFAMSGHRGWREPTNLIQIRRVRDDSLLDPTQRSYWVQGGFGFEIAI